MLSVLNKNSGATFSEVLTKHSSGSPPTTKRRPRDLRLALCSLTRGRANLNGPRFYHRSKGYSTFRSMNAQELLAP